ncbi:MAG: hypothetical protein K2K21_07555 [Lachnospiraceae bacterium]|nr:hypothetical protein [Lachnospiraceae bacterium]
MANLFECSSTRVDNIEIIETNIITQTRSFNWTSSDLVNGWNHYAEGNVTFSFPNKMLGLVSISGNKGRWHASPNTSNQSVYCFGRSMAANNDGTGNTTGTTTVIAVGY